YPAIEEGVLRALYSAGSADVIVKASGTGVFDQFLEAAVVELKNASNLVAFWDGDLPATLGRVHAHSDDPFLRVIPRYDVIFTHGGGRPLSRAYRDLGARLCVPIYNALDPEAHRHVPPEARFAADLGFLRNGLPDSEKRVEEFFLTPAAALPQ